MHIMLLHFPACRPDQSRPRARPAQG